MTALNVCVFGSERKPRTDRSPFHSHHPGVEDDQLLRRSGQVLPRARPQRRGMSNRRFRFGAAGFAAAFPADFPPCVPTLVWRASGGSPSAIYFFFFSSLLLAFLFFAITSSLKVKEASTAPRPSSNGRFDRRASPTANLFVAGGAERLGKLFSCQKLVLFAKIRKVIGKNFQQHLHILRKAARIISRKNGA